MATSGKRTLLLVAVAALAWPVQAHDFWYQPGSFRLPAPGAVAASFQIGHGDDRETWSVRPERIAKLQAISPSSTLDLRATLRPGVVGQPLPLNEAGLHMVVFENTPIQSVLPAVRFNAYLHEEGLTPALQERERSGRQREPGRELYSRRGKALVQVGPPSGRRRSHATTPVGLTLELVPERDPYSLRRGEGLPVRVYYQGRPLPGALVKLTDLGRDEKPLEVRRTDRTGRAVFHPRQDSDWLLNVVWTRPLQGDPRGDFETVFSSLTFGHSSVGR